MADQELQISPIQELREQGSPLQRLFGETLHELGGMDFLAEWAEDYPDQFVRLLIVVNPPTAPQGPSSGPTINLNLPAGCGPGPLDVVADQ